MRAIACVAGGAVCILFLPIRSAPLAPFSRLGSCKLLWCVCTSERDAVTCDADLRPSMADKWVTWQTRIMCMLRVRADGCDRHWNIDTNLGYAATRTAHRCLLYMLGNKIIGIYENSISLEKCCSPPHAALEAWKVIKRVQITYGAICRANFNVKIDKHSPPV